MTFGTTLVYSNFYSFNNTTILDFKVSSVPLFFFHTQCTPGTELNTKTAYQYRQRSTQQCSKGGKVVDEKREDKQCYNKHNCTPCYGTVCVRYLTDICCIYRVTLNGISVRPIFGWNLGEEIRNGFLTDFLVEVSRARFEPDCGLFPPKLFPTTTHFFHYSPISFYDVCPRRMKECFHVA